SEIVKQESDPEPSQQTEVSTILDHEETSIKIMGLCVEPHVISDLREMQNQINQILGLCSATTDNILFHALTSHDPHSGTKSKIREEVVKKLIDQNIEPQIIMRAIQCLLIDHQIKSRTSDDMHATLKQPKYEEIIPVLELLKKDCTNPEHLLSQQIWEKTVVTTYQEANKLFAIQSNSERFKTAFFPEKIVTDEQYQSIQKEVRDIFDKEDELDRYGAKAYFTPDINSTFKPDLISILVKLVSDEQTGISAAYFRFTHHDLAQAFIKKSAELKKTLVSNPVQLIVDQKFNEDHCYALKMLFDNNIPVMCNGEKKRFDGHKTEEYLHHKFMILHKNKDQKSLLVTGSFNPTGQANTNSSENIIIIDDSIAIRKFLHEFQILKKHARTIEPTECEQGKTFGSEHAVVINGFDPKNFGFGP
ncbi:MAG TPA: phospholipase D-like domain-containing protein, partial [Candidatus Babeliales bacterium]|nr:phospholipase D-like domain-containing protein [Candidatus Babeliales bacterium]